MHKAGTQRSTEVSAEDFFRVLKHSHAAETFSWPDSIKPLSTSLEKEKG